MARLSAVVEPNLRLDLSDSSCILFSTELSLKNRFSILFGGFYGWNWRIPVLMRTRLNIEPYSPLKPTQVGFIFIP